MKELPR
jgi:hypothetical protein